MLMVNILLTLSGQIKKTWEVSSEIEMSPEYEMHTESMRESLNLESTKFIYQMEVEIDYLQWRALAL
tara:strand:+ start:853 stop:1053 length:201 start_codon:yes stop_codon:yes gene_type:complete